jgi:hypothetical protein
VTGPVRTVLNIRGCTDLKLRDREQVCGNYCGDRSCEDCTQYQRLY